MDMYVIRCLPNRSTGISPFVAMHGWEPTTPLQLLYNGWVQKGLGPINLEEWVQVNTERVQNVRDISIGSQVTNSTKRKEDWDKKAQVRQFEKGDRVHMRKPGLSTKLEESWAGPYTILKRNLPLSYKVTTGDRILPFVHIQLLKLYTQRESTEKVKRVTTVLDPHTISDSIEDQYAEAKVTGIATSGNREADIAS